MLITFLRRLYDRQVDFDYSDEQLTQVMDDIATFQIYAQVHHVLKNDSRKERLPGFFTAWLKEKAERVCYQNLLIKTETEALIKKFDRQCIPSMPLKGTRFAEKYFGHFAARGTSDIDILVIEPDLTKAIEFAEGLGYQLKTYNLGHHNVTLEKASSSLPAPLELELHHHIMDPQTCNLSADSLWSNCVPYGNFLWAREMSVQQTFYMICLHGIKHRMDSIKYILDVLQMIEYCGNEIDYELLLKQAEKDKTKSRIIAALSIVYQCFPHLHQIKPFRQEDYVLFWKYSLIRKMNQKNYRVKPIFNKLFPFFLLDSWSHRLNYILRM
ncbi:nucleotidyltransferase family protein [Paenibacillus montanisoli]|uniref:Nucleotidyltransferase family protein n=1 Tax=Paenibacillus montanisoli TaxID=2081970 RepID=A0A328U987_9BACL|nr:nucleotidyltransferase family protein [Paenibacillus montanisoli]RAP77475.1 hypothetical protein DL346_03065 [Paenibacillus montanisoli]